MADIAYYVAQANEQAAHDRHGLRTQTYAHGPDFRAYVPMGKRPSGWFRRRGFDPHHELNIVWETNADGRLCYMGRKARLIFAAALAEIAAGRELHTSTLSNMTGASQGYVTKTLQFLHRFHFIVVTAVKRGRYGGILAHLATAIRQSFHHRGGVSLYGGMIKADIDAGIAEWHRRMAAIDVRAAEILVQLNAGWRPVWYVE